MITLNTLSGRKKQSKRVGRGPGSGKGKTCGRGQKGMGARSGSKRRHTYEGGQFRLFQKLPTRGFSNVNFQKKLHPINLGQLEEIFSDGDIVSLETLRERGFFNKHSYGIKVLADGVLTKKVTIEASAFSKEAQKKLEESKITFKVI